MKLELKHIKGYLDTGLKLLIKDEVYIMKSCFNGTSGQLLLSTTKQVWINNFPKISINPNSNDVKPLLCPLSGLTKEIEQHFKGQFTFAMERGKLILNEWRENKEDLWMSYNGTYESYPYNVVEWLFSKHADVYGLIEVGLVTDINTLKQANESTAT